MIDSYTDYPRFVPFRSCRFPFLLIYSSLSNGRVPVEAGFEARLDDHLRPGYHNNMVYNQRDSISLD